MRLKVKNDAQKIYLSKFTEQQIPKFEWKSVLGKIEGKEFEVSTNCLFSNQFNIITDDGLVGIEQEYVEWVKDDARKGMGKCGYCGKISQLNDKQCDCDSSYFKSLL